MKVSVSTRQLSLNKVRSAGRPSDMNRLSGARINPVSYKKPALVPAPAPRLFENATFDKLGVPPKVRKPRVLI